MTSSTTRNGKPDALGRWIVEVVVVPKEGVNDPEGEAILGGLRSLGYTGVERARSGRFYTLTLSAPDGQSARAEAEKMADRLLANPVIQAFRIESVTSAPSTGRRM
jgi:phosphoribosylformylglycinamidine synthase